MFNFEKLEVDNKALLFSKEVYKETIDWPSRYQFNLCDQLRRASLSISLNIAEGSAKSKADFRRFMTSSPSQTRGSSKEDDISAFNSSADWKSAVFLNAAITIARGSCFECVPLIEMSYELKLLSVNKKDEWYNSLVSLAQMLSKLKSSLSN